MVRQAWRERLERAVPIAVAQIAHGYQPERIILFGSSARGDINEDSDIDLLVVKESPRPFMARIDEVQACLSVDVPVEVLVYTPAELARMQGEGRDFVLTVLGEGKVVYDKPS